MIKAAVQDFLGSASLKISDTFAPDDDNDFYVPTPPMTPKSVPIKPSQSLPQIALVSEEHSDNRIMQLPHANTQLSLSQSQYKFGPVTKFKNMVLGRPNTPLVQESLHDFTPFSGPRNANQVAFGRSWRTPDNLLVNRNRFRWTTSNRRTQGDGCDILDTARDADALYLGEYLISGRIN